VRSAADSEAVAEFCHRHHLTSIGEVPFSDAVVDADRVGRPLLDTDGNGSAVAAVAGVLQSLGVPA